MKIGELIILLEAIKKEQGDLQVILIDNDTQWSITPTQEDFSVIGDCLCIYTGYPDDPDRITCE